MRYNDYLDIRKGDRVYYHNRQGQLHYGKAVLYGPAGWVLDCAHGSQVVGHNTNYAGHKHSKGRREDDHFGKWLNSPSSI
jgi:hypothetical protein